MAASTTTWLPRAGTFPMPPPISIPAEIQRTLAPPVEGPDVLAVKSMLNHVVQAKLDLQSARYDAATSEAVRRFQRQERLGVDGKVGRQQTYPALLQAYRYLYRLATDPGVPRWLKAAYGEIGQAEVAGAASNARIVEYLNTCPALKRAHTKEKTIPVIDRKTKKPRLGPDGKPLTRIVWDTSSPLKSEVDETAWCAAFVNWCLRRAGLPGLDTDMAGAAEAWLDHGTPLDAPRYGAIAVIYREKAANSSLTSSGFHVGFVIDHGLGDVVTLLGGNQGNQVKVSRFTGWEIKGFSWPVRAD